MTTRIIVALAFVTALAGTLHAAPPTPQEKAEATKLFKEGTKLLDDAEYVGALDRFNQAYALWANPKILINIGTSL